MTMKSKPPRILTRVLVDETLELMREIGETSKKETKLKTKQVLNSNSLREILSYNPETGVFTRISGVSAGSITGTTIQKGYVLIKLMGKNYRAHRLAWLYVHGEWPKYQIDHINNIKTDNRMANLRDVPGVINKQNMAKPLKGNAAGFLGVSPSKKTFRADIRFDGKTICLGTSFKTAEMARDAYLAAKKQHHPGFSITQEVS